MKYQKGWSRIQLFRYTTGLDHMIDHTPVLYTAAFLAPIILHLHDKTPLNGRCWALAAFWREIWVYPGPFKGYGVVLWG